MRTNHPPSELPAGKPIRGFALYLDGVALLPDEHELIVNTLTGHFTVINWEVRFAVADGLFERDALPFILTLLHAWPSFVERSTLLEAVTDRTAAEAADHLERLPQQAIELLERLAQECRSQLHQVGIEVENTGAGYKLSPVIHDPQPESTFVT